jgi:hypothetical protein
MQRFVDVFSQCFQAKNFNWAVFFSKVTMVSPGIFQVVVGEDIRAWTDSGISMSVFRDMDIAFFMEPRGTVRRDFYLHYAQGDDALTQFVHDWESKGVHFGRMTLKIQVSFEKEIWQQKVFDCMPGHLNRCICSWQQPDFFEWRQEKTLGDVLSTAGWTWLKTLKSPPTFHLMTDFCESEDNFALQLEKNYWNLHDLPAMFFHMIFCLANTTRAGTVFTDLELEDFKILVHEKNFFDSLISMDPIEALSSGRFTARGEKGKQVQERAKKVFENELYLCYQINDVSPAMQFLTQKKHLDWETQAKKNLAPLGHVYMHCGKILMLDPNRNLKKKKKVEMMTAEMEYVKLLKRAAEIMAKRLQTAPGEMEQLKIKLNNPDWWHLSDEQIPDFLSSKRTLDVEKEDIVARFKLNATIKAFGEALAWIVKVVDKSVLGNPEKLDSLRVMGYADLSQKLIIMKREKPEHSMWMWEDMLFHPYFSTLDCFVSEPDQVQGECRFFKTMDATQ